MQVRTTKIQRFCSV